MRLEGLLLMSLIVSLLPVTAVPAATGASPASPHRQAVVVKTADWRSYRGSLQRYERSSPQEAWQPAGEAVPVVVGRNGLGWGLGLHPLREGRPFSPADDRPGRMPRRPPPTAAGKETEDPPDPAAKGDDGAPGKREGDGRAPAGIFRLSGAFGYAPGRECPWIKLPYREATSSLKCVDDSRSRHYNRLVNAGEEPKDWSSCEEMRRPDDQYRLGIVVEHNAAPAIPDRGSCIFIHIWKGPEVGTAGCTAMAPEDMETLLRWLDPAAVPVLIQLPESAYRQLKGPWELP